MDKSKKSSKQSSYQYLCPYCGNQAPARLKYNHDIKCFYCRRTYTKEERIKVYIGKK